MLTGPSTADEVLGRASSKVPLFTMRALPAFLSAQVSPLVSSSPLVFLLHVSLADVAVPFRYKVGVSIG